MTRKVTQIPGPTGATILAEDLDFKTIKDDWSAYELEDGSILKAKIVALKISRALADDKKSILYLPNGEPFYNIRYNVSIVAQVPDKLIKK